jgi:hypothetical protein
VKPERPGPLEEAVMLYKNARGQTVPCFMCGAPTPMVSVKRCDCCWEVERRLPRYLKTKAGREHVQRLVEQAEQGNLPDVGKR